MTSPNLPHPQDKLGILKKIVLFSSCTDEELQLVVERSRLVEYKKSEAIFQEGDLAEAFYIVASGRLQVFTVVNGQRRAIAMLHNGDTFGEISLLTGDVHSATVEAVNDTLVLQLEKPDFDELINRIPSLVLHLSRLLSRRLRTTNRPGIAGEATIVAIYSAAKGVGRTLFAVSLATMLRRETGREVILVDFSTPDGETNRLHATLKHSHMLTVSQHSPWSEESLEHEVLEHALKFHFLDAEELTADAQGQARVAPLVNSLAKRYGYILMDLPVELNPTVLKALTQADQIYLVSDLTKDNVMKTHALIHQLHTAVSSHEEQIKIVLNLMDCAGELMVDAAAVSQSLERPIMCVLPNIETPLGELTPDHLLQLLEGGGFPYALAVRRIARELGGVLVGLALGSGAALGLAHIGVLKVLERERIPVDLIAGSSIGAMIAGLWAAGKSAKELERMALRFKNPWDVRRMFIFDFSLPAVSLFLGIASGFWMGWLGGLWAGLLFGLIVSVLLGLLMGPLVGGPIQGSQLMARLEADFEGKTFEQCRIPLLVVASNPIDREEVVFTSGRIAPAVRASVSIPGIFKPVIQMGKLCLDGGVVNPVPVSVLKQRGANRIIAVNVFSPTPELAAHRQEVLRRRAEWDAQLASRSFPVRILARLRQELIRSVSPLVFDVIMRAMQAMEYQISEVACREADIILRPTLPGSHWLEFYNPEKFIHRGEEEALKLLPSLKRLVGLPESLAVESQGRSGALTSHGQAGRMMPS
ncbi:MAG: cyclic nucleotide-binding domain-containing protein [Candidatus Omnitrophica bacterium]|nr:cyclic nucleotide-binding domain-containing protein [Candidatus Omnitrophota bacterium]